MKQLLIKLVATAHSFKPFGERGRAIWAILKEIAPYAAIELILPGGTLLAILCWLYKKRHATSQHLRGLPAAPHIAMH